MTRTWKEVSPYTGSGIEEDAPANAAGGGNIHGIGVGPHGEPGVDPKKKKKKEVLIDREGKIDGRTKRYREHRKKLETARQKRMEIKNKSSFIEEVIGKLDEYTSGYDKAHPVASLNAAKSSTGYELYHKTFSGAMQHAYAFAKKKGYIVDTDDIDSKVASGPRKPSSGKTNKYILGTDKKQNVHIQVANLDNKRYELNMYIS